MSLDENPFASGEGGDDGQLGAAVSRLEPVAMDVGPILTRSWEIFMDNLGLVIGTMACVFVPAIGFAGLDFAIEFAVGDLSENPQPEVYAIASLGTSLVSMVVNLFLSLGMTRIFVRLAHGDDADLSMIIGEGPNFLSALLSSILLGIALVFGFLLFIIPGFVLGVGLQFYLYCLVDENLGPVEALQRSWEITDGYKLTIFMINFVIALLALVVTCLTMGLGYFVIVPVMQLATAVMYHSITNLYDVDPFEGLT